MIGALRQDFARSHTIPSAFSTLKTVQMGLRWVSFLEIAFSIYNSLPFGRETRNQ
jgi:hypothetical protein